MPQHTRPEPAWILAFRAIKLGDYLVLIIGFLTAIWLFQTLWAAETASKVQIRQGDHIIGTYSLNQSRTIEIAGAIGHAHIQIEHRQVRFSQSPCLNQYCVHQGWLKHAGEAAICLPNQLSIELSGGESVYDSLNY
jgi:hypothetical protein